MEIWKAIILGLIQGIAEFLPVSSTGHLTVFQHILQAEQANPLFFDSMLHLGTLLAVMAAFRRDVKRLLKDGLSLTGDWICNLGIGIQNIGRREKKKRYRRTVFTTGRKLFAMLLITSSVTAVIGLFLLEFTEKAVTTLLVPGIGFILNGLVLLRADRAELGMKRANESEYLDAAVIGTAQGLAVIPGLSQFGMTLSLGMCCGLEKGFAVKYSFLSLIPAAVGAAIVEGTLVPWSAVGTESLLAGGIGLAVSFAAGILCIKGLLYLVQRKRLLWPALYCILAGAAVLAYYFIG